ncbi:MAG TPA: hypothetical protein VEA99_01590 [Gemmatimonadaceae bacterium]|nr:hypothetical protein [Gemmatimonadaceae bacterium]
MYSTCLFCRGPLGRNEAIEALPIGRRLAVDARRGRLWIVCDACARWNLTPLDERWLAIEECERAYRGTTVRVSTGNIGLARLRDGTEIVRIGRPLRPEFAAWRYGVRFDRRRRERLLLAGGAAAFTAIATAAAAPLLGPVLALGAVSIVALPGVGTVLGTIPILGTLALRDWLREDRVVTRLADARGRTLAVRARHLLDVELHVDRRGGPPTLVVPNDGGWATYVGASAVHVTGVLLAGTNRHGGSARDVQRAVGLIESEGDAAAYLATAAQLGGARHRVLSRLNELRRLGALRLSTVECLALEMAVHEDAERRALDGELEALEGAWREAEEVGAIADAL